MPPKRGKPGKTAQPPEKRPAPTEDDEADDDDRSSDSDFDLDKTAAVSDSDESDNDALATEPAGKRKRSEDGLESVHKRARTDDEVNPSSASVRGKKKPARARGKVRFADLDSGDEVTINQGGRRSKRGDNRSIEIDEDEEGGEGGWVKTRSQRAREGDDDRPLATTDGATIDVDDVWARLAALPVGRPSANVDAPPVEDEADFIIIKRTTRYAGEVTTEEKRVHRNSAEAKLYLQEQENKQKPVEGQDEAEPANAQDNKPSMRRPLKRLSRFEANPTGEVKALPPHLQLRWPRTKTAEMALADSSRFSSIKGAPPAKINTVDKSRQDWAGFVDKSGIADELDKYGKSKSTYLGRQDFLNRTENHVEQDLRAARQNG